MPHTPGTNNTALLVFTRSPEEEARIKSFTRSSRSLNHLIAHELVDHTLKVAYGSKLTVEVRYEHQQRGKSFGERYANAFAELFELGYDKVVSIGNDSPRLQTSHLNEADHRLENEDLVLGPAYDGGVYLVAFRKEAFDKEAFQNIHWESAAVQKDFQEYIADHSLRTSLLNPLGDLDSEADLALVLQELSPKTLLYQLLVLAVARLSINAFSFNEALLPLDPTLSLRGLRAPPALA